MNPDVSGQIPDAQREEKPAFEVLEIDPEDRDAIAAYYQFEVDRGFSSVPQGSTLDRMADYRQQQLRQEKLKVVVGREGPEVVATSVLVLEPETMGKLFDLQTEAWAAGTLVSPGRRGQRIGERMSAAQDAIARAAGRQSLVTAIDHDNIASIRLRMRVGYVLDGVIDQKPVITEQLQPSISYRYRKNLQAEPKPPHDVSAEVAAGTIKVWTGSIDDRTPETILLDPQHKALISTALEHGYQGTWLVMPEDFQEAKHTIDKPYFVFKRHKVADKK